MRLGVVTLRFRADGKVEGVCGPGSSGCSLCLQTEQEEKCRVRGEDVFCFQLTIDQFLIKDSVHLFFVRAIRMDLNF